MSNIKTDANECDWAGGFWHAQYIFSSLSVLGSIKGWNQSTLAQSTPDTIHKSDESGCLWLNTWFVIKTSLSHCAKMLGCSLSSLNPFLEWCLQTWQWCPNSLLPQFGCSWEVWMWDGKNAHLSNWLLQPRTIAYTSSKVKQWPYYSAF